VVEDRASVQTIDPASGQPLALYAETALRGTL